MDAQVVDIRDVRRMRKYSRDVSAYREKREGRYEFTDRGSRFRFRLVSRRTRSGLEWYILPLELKDLTNDTFLYERVYGNEFMIPERSVEVPRVNFHRLPPVAEKMVKVIRAKVLEYSENMEAYILGENGLYQFFAHGQRLRAELITRRRKRCTEQKLVPLEFKDLSTGEVLYEHSQAGEFEIAVKYLSGFDRIGLPDEFPDTAEEMVQTVQASVHRHFETAAHAGKEVLKRKAG